MTGYQSIAIATIIAVLGLGFATRSDAGECVPQTDGSCIFFSEDTEEHDPITEGRLTINGANDVTTACIDTSDAEITALTVDSGAGTAIIPITGGGC